MVCLDDYNELAKKKKDDYNEEKHICYYNDLVVQNYYLFIFNVNFIFINAGVGATGSALDEDGVLEIDTTVSLETTWHAMEDLVSMGLVRSIGIR